MPAFFFALIVFQAAVLEAYAIPVLDSSFGTNGIARIGVPAGAEDTPSVSVMQSDGKLLVAGWTAGRQAHAFVLRLNANGGLDSSFGNGGVTLFDLPSGYNWYTIGQIEQRPDGSILIGAQVYGGFMFTRLTPSGAFDSTFAANGFFFTAAADSSNSARFIQQTDGGILIISDATQGTQFALRRQFALRLTRLTAAGDRDLAYAPNGEKMLDSLPPNFVMGSGNSVAAEPDGGFTVMARATFNGGSYLLVRVTDAGILNTSFGASGLASGYDLGNPLDLPVDMVRTADGRLLLIGDVAKASDTPQIELTGKVVLWRVTTGGLTDVSFGMAGRLEVGSGNTYSSSYQLAALTNGSIAFVGSIGSNTVSVMRFDSSGVPDAVFGAAGHASITLADYNGFSPIGVVPDNVGGLLIPGAAALKIECYGARPCTSKGMDVVVANLDSTGSLQLSYGRGDGFFIWNSSEYSNDAIDTILSEPTGKIVLAGTTDEGAGFDYLIARLTASGLPDTTFGTSGRVLPKQFAHFIGAVRAVEQESGAITVATGTAAGSFGNVTTVTAFRLNSVGMIDAGFANHLAAPWYPNTTVALGVRPDGRLLYGTVSYDYTLGLPAAVLEQLMPDGSLDSSFGSNGIVKFSLDMSESSQKADLRVLVDGSIVFAVLTTKEFTTKNLRVFKLDAQGVPVVSFGVGGQFTYDVSLFDSADLTLLSLADGTLFAGYPGRAIRISANGILMGTILGGDYLTALPDASVLIARNTDPPTLYRLFPDNSLDGNFGLDGAYPLLGIQSVSALATDSNGRILVAGQDSTSAILASYLIDGSMIGATVVEFYNTNLDHYFITADTNEAAAIDGGSAGLGWIRTGNSFKSGGITYVCRFYGSQSPGPNSHFYTLAGPECDGLKQLQASTPATEKRWNLESLNFVSTPASNGICPAGTTPVYRAYNNGFSRGVDSNHRITSSATAIQEVVTRGWSNEGVVMCAPN